MGWEGFFFRSFVCLEKLPHPWGAAWSGGRCRVVQKEWKKMVFKVISTQTTPKFGPKTLSVDV